MFENLDAVDQSAKALIKKAESIKELEDAKVKVFGRKGLFAELSDTIKTIVAEQRTEYGKKFNSLKNELTELLDQASKRLEAIEGQGQLEEERIDVTADPSPADKGALHPITAVQYELEDMFSAMGFIIMDGPHIDSEYYNFEALNIPKEHPARDMQDTFFFENGEVLRTQTSTLQIRAMEIYKPPLRVIGPGKVFRAENIDATHECCFHQIEGMVVDKGISVAHLKYFIQAMLSKIFKTNAKIRLRPGYFPFVEPGYEVELGCLFCDQKGCRICKGIGWIELMGCGMIHPYVLRNGGIDPDQFSGFAFGMGIDRLAMSKYGINDIRLIHNPDIRFHRFFS